MARPQIHPLLAISCGLFTFALIEAALVPLGQFASSGGQTGDKVNLFGCLTALIDWSACIAAVLMSMKFSRTKPVVTATFMALILAIWHLAMIFALFNFASVLHDAIVPGSIVYYGGLLVTGAVLVLFYERRTLVSGSQANRGAQEKPAKPSIYGQALATAGLDTSLAQSLNAKANRLPRNFELSEAEERSASFFDLDLILLEDELLKIKPDRNAYISALRLGIAIEKTMGYVNCRARTFTFAELMRDVCTRLAVCNESVEDWLTLAEGFRYYHQEDRLERRMKIAAYEDYLVALQYCGNAVDEETQTKAADEAEHKDPTDSGTKILAVAK